MTTSGTALEAAPSSPGASVCSITILPGDRATLSPAVREAWAYLDAGSAGVYGMYRSLRWWDHLRTTRQGPRARLAIARDPYGTIVGVAPMLVGDYPLEFALGRGIALRMPIRALHVLGGEPLIPPGAVAPAQLFRAIWEQVPEVDAIYLKGMSTSGWYWEALRAGTGQAIVYVERGIRDFYSIALPRSFEQYLARFSQKRRYNLKRQVRVLRESSGGALELVRVEQGADISRFLGEARLVASHSWQHRRASKSDDGWGEAGRLEDLALRDVLRCYLLRAGDVPCAYVIGYQSQGVFHYADVGYDERFAAFSPGAVLLYLLIQDLIQYRPPRLLNFGVGDSEYKRQFATDVAQEASVLLLRSSGINQARYRTHRAYRALGRRLRSLIPNGLAAAPFAAETCERLGGA